MRKNKSFKFAFALFSLVWTGVAVLLIALFVPGIVQDYMVVNNGEKIEAVITGSHVDTSYTENGKNYWYMTYQYEYGGKPYKGKTTSSYDEAEVLEVGTVINVLYYNGRTVQEDYSLDNSSIFIGVFILISLSVGIGMGIATIKCGSKDKKMAQIKETGKKATATYITSYSNMRVNNVPYYKVKYKYKDSYGIERTEESLGYCLRDEAEYLEALKEFEIAYADGKSVVVEDLVNRKSLLDIVENNENGEMEHVAPLEESGDVSVVLPNTKYECPCCGAVSEPTSSGTCQYCGTQINK